MLFLSVSFLQFLKIIFQLLIKIILCKFHIKDPENTGSFHSAGCLQKMTASAPVLSGQKRCQFICHTSVEQLPRPDWISVSGIPVIST